MSKSKLNSLKQSLAKSRDFLISSRVVKSVRGLEFPKTKVYRSKWTGEKEEIVSLLQSLNEKTGTLINQNDVIIGQNDVLIEHASNSYLELTKITDNTNCTCEALKNLTLPKDSVFTFDDGSTVSELLFNSNSTASWVDIISTAEDTAYSFKALNVPEWIIPSLIVSPFDNFSFDCLENTSSVDRSATITLVQDFTGKQILLNIKQEKSSSIHTWDDGTTEKTIIVDADGFDSPTNNYDEYLWVPYISTIDGVIVDTSSVGSLPSWFGNVLRHTSEPIYMINIKENNTNQERSFTLKFKQKTSNKECSLTIVQKGAIEFFSWGDGSISKDLEVRRIYKNYSLNLNSSQSFSVKDNSTDWIEPVINGKSITFNYDDYEGTTIRKGKITLIQAITNKEVVLNITQKGKATSTTQVKIQAGLFNNTGDAVGAVFTITDYYGNVVHEVDFSTAEGETGESIGTAYDLYNDVPHYLSMKISDSNYKLEKSIINNLKLTKESDLEFIALYDNDVGKPTFDFIVVESTK